MGAQAAKGRGTQAPERQGRQPARQRAPEHKILRIGIIHNGRIVEERLIPAGTPVTVGDHPKCTVVISDANLPARRFELFSEKTGRYALQFTDSMHGKVSVGDQVVTLAALAKRGTAKKKGTFYVLRLTDKNRGKVYVGDYTVLFQFVTPPPQPVRVRSSDFRAFRWEDVDWLFLGVLLLSALLHTAAVIWIESQPPPKHMRLEDFPDRFVRLLLPEDPKPIEIPTDEDGPPTDETAPKPDDSTPEEVAEPEPGDKPEEPQETEEDRRQRLEEEAASKGLLALIGTAGDTTNSQAVADLLSDASSLSEDVGKALANSSGVAIGTRDGDQAGLRGGGGGEGAAGIGDLGAAGGGKGGTVQKKKTAVRVKTGTAEIAGTPEDSGSIRSTMKRYNGRVKSCYERELKSNPDLRGKVTVSFEIDTSGVVSGVSIEDNTTGNADLGKCISTVVRRIKFVPPPEDDVEVAGYPFILSSE